MAFGESVLVSFQRYLLADAPPLPQIPKSLGALEPHELELNRFAVPLRHGEAVWIAAEFKSPSQGLRIRARLKDAWHEVAMREIDNGIPQSLAGIELSPSNVRFAASEQACDQLEFEPSRPGAAPARVVLLDAENFRRLTGRTPPPPAKREDGYGDWRLP